MASTTSRTYTNPASAGQLRARALAIVGAVIAAIAVWVIETPVLGLQLNIRFGDGPTQTIGAGFIVGATFVASLLGWAVLGLLERRTPRARAVWTVVAIVVLLLSLSLPLYAGTTASTKVALALMHIAVAAVLIPTLRATSPMTHV